MSEDLVEKVARAIEHAPIPKDWVERVAYLAVSAICHPDSTLPHYDMREAQASFKAEMDGLVRMAEVSPFHNDGSRETARLMRDAAVHAFAAAIRNLPPPPGSAAVEQPVSLNPLPTDQFLALPARERSLQAIADVIAYWIKWVATEGFKHEEYELNPDTNIMLSPWDNAPPHWPSVGQLTRWLEILRAGAITNPLREAIDAGEVLTEALDLIPRMSDDDPIAPALADWCRRVRNLLDKLGERK